MTDLAELERRIIAALTRVDAGLDRLQAQAASAAMVPVAEVEQGGTADPWAAAPETEAVPEDTPEVQTGQGADAPRMVSLRRCETRWRRKRRRLRP